jgi:hypothetical protein
MQLEIQIKNGLIKMLNEQWGQLLITFRNQSVINQNETTSNPKLEPDKDGSGLSQS